MLQAFYMTAPASIRLAKGVPLSILEKDDAEFNDLLVCSDGCLLVQYRWKDSGEYDHIEMTELTDDELGRIVKTIKEKAIPQPKHPPLDVFHLEIHVPKENMHDSMLIESGTIIATMTTGNYKCEIRVCGEVRVVYKGVAYRSPEAFPEELREMFASGKADNSDEVFIDDNNWYELFVDDEKGWTGWSEVLDSLDNLTPAELAKVFEDAIESYLTSLQGVEINDEEY